MPTSSVIREPLSPERFGPLLRWGRRWACGQRSHTCSAARRLLHPPHCVCVQLSQPSWLDPHPCTVSVSMLFVRSAPSHFALGFVWKGTELCLASLRSLTHPVVSSRCWVFSLIAGWLRACWVSPRPASRRAAVSCMSYGCHAVFSTRTSLFVGVASSHAPVCRRASSNAVRV